MFKKIGLKNMRVSDEQINAMLESSELEKEARAKKMPDEVAALMQLHEAYTRLKELGWSDAIYCPKDGSMFSAVCAGSVGVHKCNYTGEWPKGNWWVYDGDAYTARPILWRKRTAVDKDVDYGAPKPIEESHPSTGS